MAVVGNPVARAVDQPSSANLPVGVVLSITRNVVLLNGGQ